MLAQRKGTAAPAAFVVMIARVPGAGSTVEASHSALRSVPISFSGVAGSSTVCTGNDNN